MYFKRPSFRRGGGIDQLTPRVRAQEGFFGNRDMFFLPPNLKNLQNQRFSVGTSGGVIPSSARKMKSFPMDASKMGIASVTKTEPVKQTKFMIDDFSMSEMPMNVIKSPDEMLEDQLDIIARIANEGKFLTKKQRELADQYGIIYGQDLFKSEDREKIEKQNIDKTAETKINIDEILESDDIKKAKSNRDFQQKVSEAVALLEDVEKKERKVIPGDDDSSITLDPMEEIKKEKDFLSGLLKNEGLEKGEIALIAARALGTEGSLKEKLDEAVKLALPIVRKKDKEDKALTLAAYKAFKEKEKATAKAGQDTTGIKDLKYQASILMQSDKYKGKSRDEVIAEIVEKKFTDSDSEATKNYLRNSKIAGQIFEYFDEVKDAKRILDAYIKDKGDNLKADDRKLKLYKETLEQAKQNFNLFAKEPEFKEVYGEMFRQFTALNLAAGGRVNRALGSPDTGEQIITTEAETIGAETAEKPVLKLTFSELRNRLPQEITDDVVQLLANSEEALQDFAYIQTQNDVDSFNLKYGVNLIIPPAPQTA